VHTIYSAKIEINTTNHVHTFSSLVVSGGNDYVQYRLEDASKVSTDK